MQVTVERVFERLQQTFALGKTRGLAWRKAQLNALRRLIVENESAFNQALASDLGKSTSEAWATELGYLLSDIRHNLKHLRGWMKDLKVNTPLVAQPARSFVHPEPLGTVLIMGAWNYPMQLSLAPSIAALAAGNCVVIKPSELAPQCSALLAKLVPKYLDNDAVVVIEGGVNASTSLLTLPFNHVFYTGGERVGKIVMSAAAKHLTPVTLELGGKSPCIVERTTNMAITARRIAWGKWTNAGQTCVAPDYILVERACTHEFLELLEREVQKQYGANSITNKDYGKIINAQHFARLKSYLDGQDVVFGGLSNDEYNKIAPTVVLNPDIDSPIMQEEIFGPILPVIEISKVDEAIDLIKRRPKPLAAYLFSHSKATQELVTREVSAGSLCINDVMMFMANHNLPFGGIGTSGMGRYHGKFGFDTFSHHKSVMKRRFIFDLAVRYAPSNAIKLYLLKKFL